MQYGYVIGSIGGTIAASLPLALVGAMAVLVRPELGFGEGELGLIIAAYFAAAAIVSLPMSHAAKTLGTVRLLAIACAGSSTALLAMAVIASEWWHLLIFMALGGTANSAVQIASTELIALTVSAGRQGLLFGLKQAAVPLATVLAGLALPAVGLTLGWRWAFLAGSAYAACLAVLIAREEPDLPPGIKSTAPDRRLVGHRSLVVLAIGAGFAGAAGNTLAPFIVEYGVASGVQPDRAGAILAIGALGGVATRIGMGLVADKLKQGALLMMSSLLAIGGAGALVLAWYPGTTTILIGASLGFVGAWGWPGVLHLAVARFSGASVARAWSLVMMGPFSGSIAGPPMFGWLVESFSYQVAWSALALVTWVGSALVLAGRRGLLAAASADPLRR